MPTERKIAVLGVGGGGCHVVERIAKQRAHAYRFCLVNSDKQSLARSPIGRHVFLQPGNNQPGWDRAYAAKSAEASPREIAEALRAADLCCVIATLGGATGSGASPVVVRIARQMLVSTVVIVTLPFAWEAATRSRNAAHSYGLLKNDATVVDLIRLSEFDTHHPNMTLDDVDQHIATRALDRIDAFGHA